MLSRKVVITSVLLVIGYCLLYYFEDREQSKNDVLSEVFSNILKTEVSKTGMLKVAYKQKSKKKTVWYDNAQKIISELETILSIPKRETYKHTGYTNALFSKYNLDDLLLSCDLSLPLQKYKLHNAVNHILIKQMGYLESKSNMIDIELVLTNRQEEYKVGETYDLNFHFFSKVGEEEGKFYFEINGEKKEIEKLPLVLEQIPEDIEFTYLHINPATGEKRTFYPKILP